MSAGSIDQADTDRRATLASSSPLHVRAPFCDDPEAGRRASNNGEAA